jgi:hypothetical protein
METIREIERALNELQMNPEPLRRSEQRLFDMGPPVSLFLSRELVRQMAAETGPYLRPHTSAPPKLPANALGQVLGMYFYQNDHLPPDVLVFGYPLANGGCDLVKIVKIERAQ